MRQLPKLILCFLCCLPALSTAQQKSPDGANIVAAVDHVDLKNVCTMMRDVQTAFAGQTISIDNKMYETACGAGADVRSVWYRASMLGMLRMWPESPLTPWTHDGQLDDVVFKVAATFPMKRMEVGVVQQGPPFDVKEFLKQIGEASGEQE